MGEPIADYPRVRRASRAVRVGGLTIGGGAAISVQTMTKTPTADVAATVGQIREAAEAGCHLVRVGVPDAEAAEALAGIVRESPLPVCADIHFQAEYALTALAAGVAKLRLNPGNIRERADVERVAREAAARGVAIRVGVNSGSVPEAMREGYPFTPEGNAEALVACALTHIEPLEELGFGDIVVSLKASDVVTTVLAYRMMAARRDYALHVGITEAGLPPAGLVRSAVGIGQLLGEGLADTIRVSLTAPPAEEVEAGWLMLRALGLREGGITLTVCPRCARCAVDLDGIAAEVDGRLKGLDRRLRAAGRSLRVAVMGCAVNGPGEAREADVGIACGKGSGMLFRHGEKVRKVGVAEMVEVLVAEAERMSSDE